MRSPDVDEVAFGLAGGCVGVIGAAFVSAAAFPPAETGARLLVMALAAGVIAAIVADWRAWLGVTVFAALVYVGFLAGHDGTLTVHGSAWASTLLIAFAALLGRGQRWMRQALERRPVH
ncbi:hypothetical protein [Paractinoplanes globisporus]|uniref:Integral membrane protein n=1 Tax=Paractinoplanes globisporus TaxID=113565 RepID=A0ABW6WZA9_9ACTN|nr:hypothetical protein [Actinoplanes globisporus]